MARPTLTDFEVELVREKVRVAAHGLFAKHGLDNVGLRTIGSEVGLTGAALYRYFPQGREEIIAAVRARAFRDLADLSEEAVESSATPLERFRAVAKAYVAFAHSDSESYRMLFSLMQTGDFPELRKAARRARDILFRAAQEAAHSSESNEDGRVMAHVAWAAIHGAVMLDTADMLQMGVDITQLVDGITRVLSHMSGPSKAAR
ncbi:MAG TPA: TetR/AcrR family transcriptional regulator [Planctomycetaceae bacterium]|nr:TetR/AcrR family transcriptional regulator [Planctomycetaceae bacterium]